MNLNTATLIGRVVRDPEIKALKSGTNVASFSLATNHIYKNSDGEKVEEVDFHNIVAFGKVVDSVISQYVKKGQLLCVQGRIRTRSWEGEDGKKNYRTEIVLDNLQLGPRAAGTGESKPRRNTEQDVDEAFDTTFGTQEPDEGSPTAKKRTAKEKASSGDDINPDEIPF